MRADRFLDTNILIYAFSNDPLRGPIADQLMADGGRISVQVLNEFSNVCRRKLGLGWSDIRARIEVLPALLGDAAPITTETHARALDLAETHTLSFYDALIIAAAAEAGCSTIETEDMQHAQEIGGVRINNPFKATP